MNKDRLVKMLAYEVEQDIGWLTRDEQDMLKSKLEAWSKLYDDVCREKGRTI